MKPMIFKRITAGMLLWAVLGVGLVQANSHTSISVNTSPENPAPGETVTISVSSFAHNLDTVFISWFVNGVASGGGTGRKSFSVTAPNPGVEMVVTARIGLPDGVVEARASIRPSTMVLLWEATDSYVPPFYRGKALPTLGSRIKVVAMPEIKSGNSFLNPKGLTYEWRKDYSAELPASGYGKNWYSYVQDYLENASVVGVTATNTTGNLSSTGNIQVAAYAPEIVFYKKDKDYGTLWEKALGSGHRVAGEEMIVAAPYFISPKDIRRPELVWYWGINGARTIVEDLLRQNILPVAVEAGTTGTASISLRIENREKLFQDISNQFNVSF